MKGKINISIIQYGGMTYRTVIDLACRLDKTRFHVNYFWCHPGKDLFSDFVHPKANKEELEMNLNKLSENDVNSIEFSVSKRYIPDPNLPWIGTNFWKLFNKIDTDVVFTWKGGRTEYPFCHIKKPIIEWNVFGFFDPTPNLFKSIAISPFCRQETIKNGISPNNTQVAFLPLNPSKSKTNLREELNIADDEIVVGMHQRVEDTIYDPHALKAINYASLNSRKKIKVIFLGGSKKYKKFSDSLGLDGVFLDATQDYTYVSKFLNTLDIYTHARRDGETLGAAIQEAMIHGLPVISHTSQWNAHIDTIGPGGIVCENQNIYNRTLLNWINNLENTKKTYGVNGYNYALKRYSWETTLNIIETTFVLAKEMDLSNWKPISLSIYNRRKYLYFIRFLLIKFSTFLLIKLFGQKGSRLLVKIKQAFLKIF